VSLLVGLLGAKRPDGPAGGVRGGSGAAGSVREGGRGRGGGTAWWAGSACLAARDQKGRMGRLATGPIGPKVEENSFSNKN
jgi:hypothetical protein